MGTGELMQIMQQVEKYGIFELRYRLTNGEHVGGGDTEAGAAAADAVPAPTRNEPGVRDVAAVTVTAAAATTAATPAAVASAAGTIAPPCAPCLSACAVPTAEFCLGDEIITVCGFFENDGGAAMPEAIIRFMPQKVGVWQYNLTGEWGRGIEPKTGSFECSPNTGNNRGPVKTDGFHFRYADGKRYIPMGTTCYAWVHQAPEVVAQTLATLAQAPFNKVRMCVFPKSMPYNQNEPLWYPFEKAADSEEGWDVTRPVSAYWRNLEDNIAKLCDLGIEADIILFHPYDRWGLSKMSHDSNLAYLDYCIRRLGAYRNVWWSLANEYEFSFMKTIEDWDAFGEKLAKDDLYRHLIGVHDWISPYPKRSWLTHVSLQTANIRAAFKAREDYLLPVIVDECGYEGNIAMDWGNISGFEMVNRIWTAVGFGCYCTHGETFHREDEVLWWAKGGALYGDSPERIKFLYGVLESLPGPMEPLASDAIRDPNAMAAGPEHAAFMKRLMDDFGPSGREKIISELTKPTGRHPDYRLQYLERSCPVYADLHLPVNGSYKVEIIDVWEMTRQVVYEGHTGADDAIRVDLPGKEGITILTTRLWGDAL